MAQAIHKHHFLIATVSRDRDVIHSTTCATTHTSQLTNGASVRHVRALVCCQCSFDIALLVALQQSRSRDHIPCLLVASAAAHTHVTAREVLTVARPSAMPPLPPLRSRTSLGRVSSAIQQPRARILHRQSERAQENDGVGVVVESAAVRLRCAAATLVRRRRRTLLHRDAPGAKVGTCA